MRFVSTALFLVCFAGSAPAQTGLRLADIGFGAGVVSTPDTRAGTEFSGRLTLQLHSFPLALTAGSWVADTRPAGAYQHDAFLAVHGVLPITAFGSLEAGPELHSLGTHLGAGARGAFLIPFARSGAAGLELFVRTSLLQEGTQFSAGAALRLAPWRGGLTLGERMPPPAPDLDANGSWQGILEQLSLLQDESSPLLDVLATSSNVLLRFSTSDARALRPTIARIARVLNGSSMPVYLTISGPAPIDLAVAATSGGFPPERITLAKDHTVTLRATRQPVVSSVRSGRSSPR